MTTRDIELIALLERALPMLVRLGDFIGNGPTDDTRQESYGTRCDLIGDIKDAIENAREPIKWAGYPLTLGDEG